MFEPEEMIGCHSCANEDEFDTEKEPCKSCYGMSNYVSKKKKSIEDRLAAIPKKYYVIKGKELRTGDAIYICSYKMVDYSIGSFGYARSIERAMVLNEKHYDLDKIKDFFGSKEVKDYLREHLGIVGCHLELYHEIKKG